MKVRITLTVEIDPEEWTTAYGVEGAQEIRADVKQYVANGIAGAPDAPIKVTDWR
jgi:hypothetical protein